MLEWLMEDDVMKAVGFYGGGAATAIGGLWVAINRLWSAKPKAQPSKPVPQTVTSASNGIAGGGDVTIDGDVSISQTPIAAWVLLGLGVVCFSLVALFGGKNTTATNGAIVGGDMQNSTISVRE